MATSSPPKVHMSHYIALCERENIAEVHIAIMNMATFITLYGIEKIRPCINTLCIIQLIEAEGNAAMEILLSRSITRCTDNAGVNST